MVEIIGMLIKRIIDGKTKYHKEYDSDKGDMEYIYAWLFLTIFFIIALSIFLIKNK
jgi:hypothetical protein